VIAPQTTGGPDQFGYTWDDGVPFAWIDATDGTQLSLTSCPYSSDEQVSMPFPFRYYGVAIADFAVNYDGYVLMRTTGNGPGCFPFRIPRIGSRSSIVAPYFGDFANASGAVYSKTGGIAPDRWMVIEWTGMHTDGDPTDSFTFEVVLHEGGDITFQYQNMSYGAATHSSVTGIEDSTGYRGLCYQDGTQIPSGTAVRFTHPPAAAHTFFYPPVSGYLFPAGWSADPYSGPEILNDGELGDDTFDLTVSSGWEVPIYGSDTNGNGTVDTGPLSQGQTTHVSFGLDVPLTPGASNTAVFTATSSVDPTVSASAKVQTAVPARFAQTYMTYGDGRTHYLFYGPWEAHGFALQNALRATPALVETRSGKFLHVRDGMDTSFGYVQVVGRMWSRSGSILTDDFVIDDGTEGGGANSVWDISVASAADGRIGVVWIEELDGPEGSYNLNVYFAVVDEAGDVLVPSINVTNNAAFGKPGDLDVPFIWDSHIAATANNRFVAAWQEQSQQAGGAEQNIYTAIYDSAGSQVQGIVNRSGVAPGAGTAGCPGIGEMSDGRVALAYSTTVSGQIEVHALDSDGNDTASTALGIDGCYLDLVDLAEQRLLVGYIDSGVTGFAVLGPDLSVVAPPTPVPNASGGSGSVELSVTRDARANGILAWEELQAYDVLNYAYVSSAGSILTPASVSYTESVIFLPFSPPTAPTFSESGSGITTYRPFADVPVRSFAAGFIERLFDDGITAGCGDDVFCPAEPATRAQMAVFLLKAKHGRDYQPPACSGIFGDVACPGDFAVDWIEELYNEGITAGCGGGNYCPNSAVRRDQMAVFLLKGEHGRDYQPPACSGIFDDVVCPGGFAVDWVEQLANEGITAGCSATGYCPAAPVQRNQMAVFLVRAFGLP